MQLSMASNTQRHTVEDKLRLRFQEAITINGLLIFYKRGKRKAARNPANKWVLDELDGKAHIHRPQF